MIVKCIAQPQVCGMATSDFGFELSERTELFPASVGRLYRPLAMQIRGSSDGVEYYFLILERHDRVDEVALSYIESEHFEIISKAIDTDWVMLATNKYDLALGLEVVSNLEQVHEKILSRDQSLLQELTRRSIL